jgi:hypothetical protein
VEVNIQVEIVADKVDIGKDKLVAGVVLMAEEDRVGTVMDKRAVLVAEEDRTDTEMDTGE